MNPNAVKQLVILVLCGIVAVLFGSILASGSYDDLLLLSYLLVGVYTLAAPGFAPLIAFGILNPFILPIPFVRGVPFILLILAICCVKLFFRNALTREGRAEYQHCFTWGIVLVFGWVALRYCMHPVFPNLSGFGANVTGFRAYLDYGICFALVVLLPFFFTTRDDVIRLLRWMGGISVFFILLFIPLVFSRRMLAALWLQRFGLFVTTFDNGWLRFVVLPGFGLNLLMLSFFPRLAPVPRWLRLTMGALGLVAIVMGGNRTSVLMGFVMVVAVLLVRRRIATLSLLVVGTALLLVAFHFIGERLDVRRGVGFWRIMSVTSRRIAEQTDAAGNAEWRMIRWKRALDEIQTNPLFGKGYGGVENAWLFTDWAGFEDASLEVGLAAGGIHNGFLNGAYSLGIPAVLFFLVTFLAQSIMSFKKARRLGGGDPVLSDVHAFVFANLAGLPVAIYLGNDLNNSMIWFFLVLGVRLTRLKANESTAGESPSPKPIEMPFLPGRMTA